MSRKPIGSITDALIKALFCVAMLICFAGLVYSLFVFVKSTENLRSSFNKLTDTYKNTSIANNDISDGKTALISDDDSPDSETTLIADDDSPDSETTLNPNSASYSDEVDKMMVYASQLQTLQSNAISTNILTFVYTFLSGTLIGIATIFTRKNYKSLKQIIANKEQLEHLEGNLLFAILYQNTIKVNSILRTYSLSLTALTDQTKRIEYAYSTIPQLTIYMQELYNTFSEKEKAISALSNEENDKLRREVNHIAEIISSLPVQKEEIVNGAVVQIDDVILSKAKENYEKQICHIRSIVPLNKTKHNHSVFRLLHHPPASSSQ